jgi:hypothetical protein
MLCRPNRLRLNSRLSSRLNNRLKHKRNLNSLTRLLRCRLRHRNTAAAQAQTQAHAHAQALQMMSGYPMFSMNYAAQMGMNMPMQGRLPPGYQWPATMGFRRPVNGVGVNGMNAQVNGQTAQMQAAHAQQMQRAMQGSVQGR